MCGTFVSQSSFQKLNRLDQSPQQIFKQVAPLICLYLNFFSCLRVRLNSADFWGFKTVFDNYSFNLLLRTIEKLRNACQAKNDFYHFIVKCIMTRRLTSGNLSGCQEGKLKTFTSWVITGGNILMIFTPENTLKCSFHLLSRYVWIQHLKSVCQSFQ